MNTIVEGPHALAKKQLYLQRLNQFYTDIRNWLQDEPLIVEPGETDMIEALGQYKAPQLFIKSEAGEVLAAFQPTGASVLLAEGAMDVKGGIGLEYVLYMLKSEPQTFFRYRWLVLARTTRGC